MTGARVIADSISSGGKRITTFVLTYPRFIHAEFMTHRAFSRNAASSRAIPAKKIRASVRMDPAIPCHWGANQKGMQAEEELTGPKLWAAQVTWKLAMHLMLVMNWILERLGLHKQVANRILEPWFNITVVCTSTEWTNFYALRNHPKAQPEIRELAEAMLAAHNESAPSHVPLWDWHLPFVTDLDRQEHCGYDLLKISAARCARVSYMNQEGKRSTFEEDIALFNRLTSEIPRHSSPCEHQAQPLDHPLWRCGNLVGWQQYRSLISNENVTVYPGLKCS
jgi:hypothetical protein